MSAMLLLVLSWLLLARPLLADVFLWEDGLPKFQKGELMEEKKIFPLPFFPVKIQDKALEEQAEIQLFQDVDMMTTLRLPRKKVFFPFPFYLSLQQGKMAQPVFLRVYPQISHGLSFDVERRGDFGLVLKVGYKDVAKATFLDVLDETDRRDLHLLAKKKGEKGTFWGTEIRNAFNNQNPRKIDLFTRRNLSPPSLFLDVRLDNISERKGIKFGSNLFYQQEKREMLLGNVHHKVENELSFQVKEKRKWGNIILRMEHFSLRKDKDFSARGLFIKKIGGQVNFRKGGFFLRAGTLKVERVLEDIEEGKVANKLNLEMGQNVSWGNPFFGLARDWVLSGESAISLVGFGGDRFLRGHLFQDIYFKQTYGLNLRWFSDFVRLSGSPESAPFQQLKITLKQQRKLLGDRSLLGKLNLSFLFIEGEWQKLEAEKAFFSKPDVRVGVGKDLWLFFFAVPVEFGLEWKRAEDMHLFVHLSTRAFL